VTCDQTRELLEAYALGVLDATERARVEEHLSSCEDCSAAVARYSEVLAGLPDALALASRLQLPTAIKQRLVTKIKAGATSPAGPSPSTAPRQGRRRRVRPLLVLAGGVVLALALASTAALSFALDHERQLKERFAGLLDQREVVLDVVDGRGTERAFLRSPVKGSGAYGKVFTNPRLRDVVIMTGRLPKLAEGERYRVLLTTDGTTQSPGTLLVNSKGFGLLVFEARRPGPRYDAVRIIREPSGAQQGEGETILSWTRER
jgi:Anti-sigma-K factor rskA/Putative zinc-finger